MYGIIDLASHFKIKNLELCQYQGITLMLYVRITDQCKLMFGCGSQSFTF